MDTNGLQARLPALAHTVAPDDAVSLEAVSAEISGLFARGSMRDDSAQAIDAAYAHLSGLGNLAGLAVAVRSSATAEDLPGFSFAGQQETYLNVIGADAVRAAVKQCWASLWTARALGYRARNHIAAEEVALAVVVQQMIASGASGVLFTANPLTGRRDEIVMDASFGLGEAIVSGQVEPDQYVVDARTRQITARTLGAKASAIVARGGGGTDSITPANAQRPALSDAQIRMLALLGQRVQAHFGTPQDIEWALCDGKLFLLQARPMTALPEPLRIPRAARFTAPIMAELFPIRPYPLDVSSYTLAMFRGLQAGMTGPLGIDAFQTERVFSEEDGVVTGLASFVPRPTWRVLYKPWLSLWRSRHLDMAH